MVPSPTPRVAGRSREEGRGDSSLSLALIERDNPNISEVNFAPFRLQANLARNDIASPGLIHQLAVHRYPQLVVAHDNFVGIPLARFLFRFFHRRHANEVSQLGMVLDFAVAVL